VITQALSDGRFIDWLLVLVAIEIIAISLFWWKTGRGISFAHVLPMIGAGACLMLAMRAILLDSPWQVLGFWLFCSLVCHLIDLRLRWTSGNA